MTSFYQDLKNTDLTVLEALVQSVDIAQHIIALHVARKAFIASESSEKLKLISFKETRN